MTTQEKKRKIVTHMLPDMDAGCSVESVRIFVPGMEQAPVFFECAGWRGETLGAEDFAVDIPVGGRGIKGFKDPRTKKTRSAFAQIVRTYASDEQQQALAGLVEYVDDVDALGRTPEDVRKDPGGFAELCLDLRAFYGAPADAVERDRNDQEFVRMIGLFLRGRLQRHKTPLSGQEVYETLAHLVNILRHCAWLNPEPLTPLLTHVESMDIERYAQCPSHAADLTELCLDLRAMFGTVPGENEPPRDSLWFDSIIMRMAHGRALRFCQARATAEILARVGTVLPSGLVMVVPTPERLPGVTYEVMRNYPTVRAYVYQNGNTIGAMLLPKPPVPLAINAPEVFAVIRAAGEDLVQCGGDWFVKDGHLVARGTDKQPVSSPSRVDPFALAAAVEQVLAAQLEEPPFVPQT